MTKKKIGIDRIETYENIACYLRKKGSKEQESRTSKELYE